MAGLLRAKTACGPKIMEHGAALPCWKGEHAPQEILGHTFSCGDKGHIVWTFCSQSVEMPWSKDPLLRARGCVCVCVCVLVLQGTTSNWFKRDNKSNAIISGVQIHIPIRLLGVDAEGPDQPSGDFSRSRAPNSRAHRSHIYIYIYIHMPWLPCKKPSNSVPRFPSS